MIKYDIDPPQGLGLAMGHRLDGHATFVGSLRGISWDWTSPGAKLGDDWMMIGISWELSLKHMGYRWGRRTGTYRDRYIYIIYIYIYIICVL